MCKIVDYDDQEIGPARLFREAKKAVRAGGHIPDELAQKLWEWAVEFQLAKRFEEEKQEELKRAVARFENRTS